MSITSIGNRRTPSTPVEITLDAQLGLPSDEQIVCLIGHRGDGAASGSSGVETYAVVEITNVADVEAAQEEAEEKFGVGSELAAMIVAAVAANEGQSSVPALKACALAFDDEDFGADDIALTNVKRTKAEFVVSPYDGVDESDLRTSLRDACAVMSGSDRGTNNQFGSFGVVFNRNVSDPSTLPEPDSLYLIGIWFPDSDPAEDTLGVAESAAAGAAKMAQQGRPFNPLNNVPIPGYVAPTDPNEWITVGPGLESESALEKGWTPVKVLPNGDPVFVRTVTMRTTINGTTEVTAYFDVQDFQVLYDFRKTVYTRYQQTDFQNTKASPGQAKRVRGENVRMAKLYESLGMFQYVNELAPQFVTERNSSDRGRFDSLIPVNVVPGLMVIATNVKAGTQFDDTLVITA